MTPRRQTMRAASFSSSQAGYVLTFPFHSYWCANGDQTFENLSATTALAGKHIQWSTATKDKILIFCARKGIAAGALDADVVAGLMQEIGFDAKDVQVYEALLKKLLGFIKVGHPSRHG
ncbi:hypothetical protein Tdes44962_MAKER07948 [Teratosphaeria destructans]|uniref:Uncharacterized protein n=1 Tax=Teratosphaeria destructans TaxID=418781 RepID=A0A9W7SY06_9PEZI|nr:hypothetical protein Tdes44962_MAKER07948 [Teratosphaeria destructans]